MNHVNKNCQKKISVYAICFHSIPHMKMNPKWTIKYKQYLRKNFPIIAVITINQWNLIELSAHYGVLQETNPIAVRN